MKDQVRPMHPAFKTLRTVVLALLACAASAPLAHARVELRPCKNNVKPAQQIQLGQKAEQQVYQQMPILPDSSPVTQYVQSIGRKLAAQAPGYKWPFNFHVANVADINAFALPGGAIFINLGTIQAATDEAQLAAVMAHEISHVVLQHSVCNMEKDQRVGLIAGLGQIAAGLILGDTIGGSLAQQGIGLTAGLSFLKNSRGAERQADLEGVGILYDAGYDPHAMPQFFETIEKKYGQGGAQFLSDHPNPGNRTEYIDKEISTFVPRAHYVTDTPQFDQIHRQVAGMHAYTSKEISSGVWKRRSPNQPVGSGVNQPAGQAAPAPQIDTSTPSRWQAFQGNGFYMEIPGNWQTAGDQNSAMFAPSGGIATSVNGQANNLLYGVLTDVYKPGKKLSNHQAFSALLAELARDNPGLKPGSVSTITVGGVKAESAESTIPAAGKGSSERDWIVGVPAQGAMRYFVFVAPDSDFAKGRPTFERILKSIRMQ
ncbi:MAG: M48 family metalloprotease [Acidobacteriota bacterium]